MFERVYSKEISSLGLETADCWNSDSISESAKHNSTSPQHLSSSILGMHHSLSKRMSRATLISGSAGSKQPLKSSWFKATFDATKSALR